MKLAFRILTASVLKFLRNVVDIPNVNNVIKKKRKKPSPESKLTTSSQEKFISSMSHSKYKYIIFLSQFPKEWGSKKKDRKHF